MIEQRLRFPKLGLAGLTALLTGVLGVSAGLAATPASAAPASAASGTSSGTSSGATVESHPARHPLPDVIHGTGDRLYPEGVAWDPTRHSLLIGSARTGRVSVVCADGSTRTLVDDPSVVSSYGLTVDAARHRLLITFGDLGTGARSTPATTQHQSGLLIADLATGRVLHRVDLGTGPGVHAANDVTVDPQGTAYVTDTLQSAVYRVDVRGRSLGAVTDPRFAATGFGLNGIVWHPRGFVLTARYDTGDLFRIDRDGRVSQVGHDASLIGADGMALREDGSLLVVTNRLGGTGTDAVHLLRSSDGSRWEHARQVNSAAWPDPVPTTAAVTPGGTYLVSGRLDLLSAGDASATGFTLRALRS